MFRGTVDQLNIIFGTSLKTYSFSGRDLIAPSVAPSLPASVGALVEGISLDQSRFLTHPDSIPQGSIPAPKAGRNRHC